ncbi:hypothetical protein AQUCO_02000108v1 [Aquilegia coerulea]|uniref:DUF4283 domain-containing protein n=1 Tax=Aquilegia coerulea TaxID=218851 RepID=A0A2G5DG26_AQUCA|nr:hypothetical protein AQUCO_02000108v1 [Aquilegia coerulea]
MPESQPSPSSTSISSSTPTPKPLICTAVQDLPPQDGLAVDPLVSVNEKPRLWSTLLKTLPPSAGSMNLEYSEPIFEEGFLQIPERIREEGAKIWEDRVVGFFIDKKLPFSYVKSALVSKWKTLRAYEMALDGDLYYFKFSAIKDRERVLDEGSLQLAGKLFIIRPWTREVENSRGMIKSVPIWVKMSRVPKDLWNPKGFSFLASTIGKPLFTDKTTENGNMLSFARVCIEIEPKKDLPSTIPLAKDQVIELEYPWKPLICTKCKVFGHPSSKCLPPPPPAKPTAWKTNTHKKPQLPSKPATKPIKPIQKSNFHIGSSSKSAPTIVVITSNDNINNPLNEVVVITTPLSASAVVTTPNIFASLAEGEHDTVADSDDVIVQEEVEDGTLHKLSAASNPPITNKKTTEEGKAKENKQHEMNTSSSNDTDVEKTKKVKKKKFQKEPGSEFNEGTTEKGGRDKQSKKS